MHVINHQFQGEDRRKSWTITIIVHALLLLLALLPFITDMPEDDQYLQAITINFEEPVKFEDLSSTKQSGAAAAAASSESSSPREQQTPREQVALASVTPVTPSTMMPVPTREIVTTEAQPEIFVPSTPTTKKSDRFFDQPIDQVDHVEVDRVEVFKEKPNPNLQQQVTWHVAEAKVTEKGAPTSFDFGKADGTGSGTGTSPTGGSGNAPKGDREDGKGDNPFADGSFPGGAGTGTGNQGGNTGFGNDGDGLKSGDFTGDGLFNRKVIKNAPIKEIATVPGKIVLNLCVNRKGAVVFAQYVASYSTIRDKSVLKKAEEYAKRYVFEEDNSGANEQCGRLTFVFDVKK
jgi:hypothetical protein